MSSARHGRRRSSRNDEREPRLGKLQLRGVNGVRDLACTIGWRRLASGEARGDVLQRMPRGDLRPAAAILEAHDALVPGGSRCDSLDLEHLETGAVDRLERQRGLESFNRGGIQFTGRPERAIAIDFGAIALKAERAADALWPSERGSACICSAGRQKATDIFPAGRAQGFRAFAFQFPTWKAYPVRIRNKLG